MLATLFIAPLLMSQEVTQQMVEQQAESRDVAYEELVAGDMDTAIAELEAALAANPGDPAILINLGSAYAALGNAERAEFHYSAALESRERYDIELADGRWMDSRDVAQMALATVDLRALAAR